MHLYPLIEFACSPFLDLLFTSPLSCYCVAVHRSDRRTCTLFSFIRDLFVSFCTRVSVRRRDRCTCTFFLLFRWAPLFPFRLAVSFRFVELGGWWVCLSADVTGALPPLLSNSLENPSTQGLVHSLSPLTSLLSLSLRHSLLLPFVSPYQIMSEYAEAQQAAANGLNRARNPSNSNGTLSEQNQCTGRYPAHYIRPVGIPRLPNARLLRTLFHPLVQLKVSCVHSILCSKLLSLSLSVMPIQAQLKSRPRSLILAINTYLRYGKSGKSLKPIKYPKVPYCSLLGYHELPQQQPPYYHLESP